MDPMVSLNIVTLVMASISLALSSLSALPHVKGLAHVMKRWFLRTRDTLAGVMAVVGVVAIVVIGVNFFAQPSPQREFGVSNAGSVIVPSLRKNKTSLSDVPAARRDATESKRWAIEPIPDTRE